MGGSVLEKVVALEENRLLLTPSEWDDDVAGVRAEFGEEFVSVNSASPTKHEV